MGFPEFLYHIGKRGFALEVKTTELSSNLRIVDGESCHTITTLYCSTSCKERLERAVAAFNAEMQKADETQAIVEAA